jgi:hypothetical protein
MVYLETQVVQESLCRIWPSQAQTMDIAVFLDERPRSLLDILTALFPCRLWENEGRRFEAIYSRSVAPSLLQPRVSHYFSGYRPHLCWLYPYLLPLRNVELISREGWRTCLGASSHKVGVTTTLVGIGSDMASSGLGLEEQEICPWVLMGLALAGQLEYFSTQRHWLVLNCDLLNSAGGGLHWYAINCSSTLIMLNIAGHGSRVV